MTMMMHYKGYEALVEFNEEAELFHSEVLNLRDVITFQGSSAAELKQGAGRQVNRSGFFGGCLSWVRRPGLGRRRGYDSALRPRQEGRCRWARGDDGGCTSRPTQGWRTRRPRRSATGHAGGSPPP